jgi:hypothetical protein
MMTASASADDRLSVLGNIDTRLITTDNYSLFDRNYTSLVTGGAANASMQAGDQDSMSHVITRIYLRFNVEAFENSKAVVSTIVDKEWGQSGVLFGRLHGDEYTHAAPTGAYGGAMTVEGYWLEGLIPGTAAKYEVGVPYMAAESGSFGESTKILNTAIAGVTLSAPLSDTINTYTWYAWLGNDFDGYFRGYYPTTTIVEGENSADDNDGKIVPTGNDWAFGTRVGFTLMEGLGLDLIFAHMLDECSVVAASDCGDENRNWVGGTVRYQYGDFSLLPSLILYFADHDTKGDTESLLLDVRAKYVTGPLSLQGRVVYTPGDSNGNDRSYDLIGVWGIPGSVLWFNLFGNAYGQNDLGPLTLNNGTPQLNIRFENHGLMHVAGRADYTLTPQTTLSAALGIFNAVEDVKGVSPANVSDKGVTYAGGTHVATEFDASLSYQLYSNASVSLWAAYAVTGDALDLMDANGSYESQDVTAAGARIVYSY